jgi:hypothetical protein
MVHRRQFLVVIAAGCRPWRLGVKDPCCHGLLLAEAPEYMVCAECESPLYDFEWDNEGDKLVSAECRTCGNDDVNYFPAAGRRSAPKPGQHHRTGLPRFHLAR